MMTYKQFLGQQPDETQVTPPPDTYTHTAVPCTGRAVKSDGPRSQAKVAYDEYVEDFAKREKMHMGRYFDHKQDWAW